MGKSTVSWAYDSICEGFNIYRSDDPMNVESLPEPLAVVTSDKREYIDTTVVDNETYYFRVGAYLGGQLRVSEEVEHVAEATGNPHWDKVVALLHFDGNLTDETGRVWEVVNGSPQFTPNSQSSEFGETILLASVDGLSTSGGGNLAFGTEDFTIEGWFRPTKGATGFGSAFFLNMGLNLSNGLSFSLDNDGRLEVRRSTSHRLGFHTSIRNSSLSFLTICRVGGTLYVGVNGVVTPQSFSLFDHTYDGTVFIGNQGAAYSYSGEIDELRITKGVARYTENFDPPTKPFPNFGN